MLEQLFKEKLSAKQKTGKLAKELLAGRINNLQVINLAKALKDADKAICLEAFEQVTNERPALADKKLFEFANQNLSSKTPRVKWESARIIANTAHLFKSELLQSAELLLENTVHPGTVVRWSAATALSVILLLLEKKGALLAKQLENIEEKEEKNSIKKIYLKGIKQWNVSVKITTKK